MEYKIKITGLDCANCALELEEEISKIENVKKVSVNYIQQSVKVDCDEDTLIKVKDVCNHFEEVKVVEDTKEYKIKIAGLDCANCALELEEEISKIKNVKKVSVNYIQQSVKVDCDEDTLIKVKDVCNHFEEVKVVEDIKEYKIRITGLDCANCASELEEIIAKIDNVEKVNVDFVKQIVFVKCSSDAYKKVIETCNNFEEVKVVENNKKENNGKKRQLIEIIIATVLFIVGLILNKTLDIAYVSYIFLILSYLIVGYKVLINTVKNIAKGRIFDENFLMTLASIGAMCINEFIEASAVMLLYQIGEFLQDVAVNSSRKEIVSLVDLKVEEANLIENDKVSKVKSESLKIGDIIQINNGDKVPVDALIIDGSSSFDTKSITGEAMYKEFKEGDEIYSSYINTGKVVKAKVVRSYENSAVSKILSLVENSSENKAQEEKFITKFAKIYTPIVCIIAVIIGLIVPLIIGLVSGNWDGLFKDYLYRALILLVISCPCALVISVPLTYFGGIGASAKKGILVKGATFLDTLSKANVIAFDKTGTLTEGNFKVVEFTSQEALDIAVSLEKSSSHPLAKAFNEYDSKIVFDEVEEKSGHGLIGKLNKDTYLVGNKKLLSLYNVKFEELNSVSTIIYVAKNDKLIGYITLDDTLKEGSKESLEELRKLGVNNQVMLSGDNQAKVDKVANELSLNAGYGNLLPEEKLSKALELKKQGTLLYVGDGINDTPVMVSSDCSFSMGKLGSDAALEASDIVLVNDDLKSIPNSIKIAKKTKKIVMENIIFSIVCKVLFMALGILNVIPLFVAVFADVGVMLIAVFNSLRMRINK